MSRAKLPPVKLRRPPPVADAFVAGTVESAPMRKSAGAPMHTSTQAPKAPKERLHVLLPAELKEWLVVLSAKSKRDQGDIVAEALELWRQSQ